MSEVIFDIKKKIEQSISDFAKNNLYDASKFLLSSLGYSSDKTLKLSPNNYSGFSQAFDTTKNSFSKEKACVNDWEKVEIIFQLGDDDLSSQSALFNTKRFDNKIIKSFLFIAIQLKNNAYNRSALAKITREVNKLTSMPAIIIFKYNNLLTISIIDRRLHKRDESKDVLEKVTLIKDVSIKKPHRAHIEILFDLSFNELSGKHDVTNFVGLHSAWQKTLDIKELNKKFYEKLFNWYLWALKQVEFPQIRPKEDMLKDEIHQSESLIRMLTRLLFVWFMKEKGLIKPILFDEIKLRSILKKFEGVNSDETIYYKAILQNLFFATLNKPIEQRKVIDKGFNPKEYGDPLVYRYDELFQDSKNFVKLFENIPFLNGGLFECLDQKKDNDNPIEIRLDGFTTKKNKQPIVPDKLFFGEYKNIDLSKDYDDKKKSKQTVFGVIDILNQYKFTIEENTPVEEEIALDPELLGKVFENLLASYNAETKTTARKQTGSFYTPREIVNYMVDESIITYLKNHIDDEERLRKLLSYNKSETENPFDEKETLILLKAIDSCKILDPACGSGAFPMGILQKMIFILHKLDPTNKLWFDMVVENIPAYMRDEFRKRLSKETWNYVRKLGIIQQCIYGVDIQPIATQIAKLRFFISLLVDQDDKPEEYNRGFEPLPNLDFKIVTANTLISAPASDVSAKGLFEDQSDPFFEEFNRLTEKYFAASLEEDKKILRKDIIALINNKCDEKIDQIERSYAAEDERVKKALKEKKKEFIAAKENEIKLWQSYANIFKHESVGFFEPRYFFPKVKDGFDIVIGNPPYIDSETMVKVYPGLREILVQIFTTTKGNWDYYIPFYEKAYQLLNQNGYLIYITPNKWLSAPYGKALREYFNYSTYSMTNCCNIKVFDAGNSPVIYSLLKSKLVKRVRVFEFTFDWSITQVSDLSLDIINQDNWGILLSASIDYIVRLNNLTNKIFNYGTVENPFSTSEAYSLTKILFDSYDYTNSFKFINTGTIDRYKSYWGIKTTSYLKKKYQYPIIRKDKFKKLFPKRYVQQNCSKLLISGMRHFEVFYDQHGEYILGKSAILLKDFDPSNAFSLLAILNSSLISFYLKESYSTLGIDGGINFSVDMVENIPLPPSIEVNQLMLLSEYQMFLMNSSANPKALINFFDSLINAIIYELYFPEEIKTADCEILKNLTTLPELKEDWSDDKKVKTIEKVYKELSNPKHPACIALFKMDTVEEVRIIEGKQ